MRHVEKRPIGDRAGKRHELPLSEATFLILLSLSPGPHHGYAILKEVNRLSDGRVELSTGTLYGAIKRLLADGWIRPSREQPEASAVGRPRKSYRLTSTGRRALTAESCRLQSLVGLARAAAVLASRRSCPADLDVGALEGA